MIQKSLVKTAEGVIARVTFTLPGDLWADTIYLVGDFNQWNYSSHPLERDHEGNWFISIDLPPGGSYQFRYLCDGEWTNDNQADAYIYTPYGSHNFLVVTEDITQG